MKENVMDRREPRAGYRVSLLLLAVLGSAAGCFEPLVGPDLELLGPDGGADVAAPSPDAAADLRDGPVDTRPPDAADARPDLAPDAPPDRAPDLSPDVPMVDAPPDVLTCPATQIACNGRCVAPQTDPDNCGGCDKPCSSGTCASSTCQMPGAGHLVLIGHDYSASSAGINNLVGNAVLLSARSPTRVLVYEGAATVGTVQGVNAAITQVTGSRGRTITTKVVAAAQVNGELPNHDVFLIHAQTGADDATLDMLGTTWATSLVAFVSGGKTIVLLDGASANNSGTIRVLKASGMFAGSTRTAATGQALTVVSTGDPVARNVPASYTAPSTSAAFQTTEVVKVVQNAAGGPVVIHRIY
jgi:hypothetical protein